jgi:Deoxyribonuclease II
MVSPEDQISIILAHSSQLLTTIAPSQKYSWISNRVDHAKWGILSVNEGDTDQDIVCITGSNREDSQARRGGEIVCRLK